MSAIIIQGLKQPRMITQGYYTLGTTGVFYEVLQIDYERMSLRTEYGRGIVQANYGRQIIRSPQGD